MISVSFGYFGGLNWYKSKIHLAEYNRVQTYRYHYLGTNQDYFRIVSYLDKKDRIAYI